MYKLCYTKDIKKHKRYINDGHHTSFNHLWSPSPFNPSVHSPQPWCQVRQPLQRHPRVSWTKRHGSRDSTSCRSPALKVGDEKMEETGNQTYPYVYVCISTVNGCKNICHIQYIYTWNFQVLNIYNVRRNGNLAFMRNWQLVTDWRDIYGPLVLVRFWSKATVE